MVENSANWLLIYVVNRLLVINVAPIMDEKLDILYDTMEDNDDMPYGDCAAATVERPYETIDDRELTPYGVCAEATVERPYETIDDSELIP